MNTHKLFRDGKGQRLFYGLSRILGMVINSGDEYVATCPDAFYIAPFLDEVAKVICAATMNLYGSWQKWNYFMTGSVGCGISANVSYDLQNELFSRHLP